MRWLIDFCRIWWRYNVKRQSLTRQGVVPWWVEQGGGKRELPHQTGRRSNQDREETMKGTR